MDKTTQPQQLSFNFDALSPTDESGATQMPEPFNSDAKVGSVIVYDFKSAAHKRKELANASLYRQILDSVVDIG